MGKLEGRTIIVTGAAQGIGASYAKAIASEGANLVVCDIIDPSDVATSVGGKALGCICDVSDAASVKNLVGETLGRFGRIDGLVNNAAIFASLTSRPFEQIESEEFDRVMTVNVRGIFEAIRGVMPTMRAQGYGKIVNISSGTFFKGTPGMAHYVASKGAVVALTRVIAREAGRDGVRVNSVAPGFTLSEGVLNWRDSTAAFNIASVAARCIPRDQQPEDLNGPIVFLLSADSDFITGQNVVVDGGSVMS